MARPSVTPSTRLRTDPAEVADRVHSAAIHLLRGLRRQDEATGISAARLSALSVLVFGGPVSIGQLATAEQVSAPTMTRLVVGMEREGLLQRKRDAEDRRVIWIRATAKGGRILREGRRRRVAALTRELDTLKPAELEQLAHASEILERIAGRGRVSSRAGRRIATDPAETPGESL